MKECVYCGKQFKILDSKFTHEFCSKECYYNALRSFTPSIPYKAFRKMFPTPKWLINHDDFTVKEVYKERRMYKLFKDLEKENLADWIG
jgi:hypothetical protein